MFFPEGQVSVHLYGEPTDMRKSFDGLYGLVRRQGLHDPVRGGLIVFVNRRGTQMKVLYFDRSGWCVWAKRLEQSCFVRDWSQVRARTMDWTGLKLLLEGNEPRRVSKRFSLPVMTNATCGSARAVLPHNSANRSTAMNTHEAGRPVSRWNAELCNVAGSTAAAADHWSFQGRRHFLGRSKLLRDIATMKLRSHFRSSSPLPVYRPI